MEKYRNPLASEGVLIHAYIIFIYLFSLPGDVNADKGLFTFTGSTFEIHGKDKLSWSKITQTAPKHVFLVNAEVSFFFKVNEKVNSSFKVNEEVSFTFKVNEEVRVIFKVNEEVSLTFKVNEEVSFTFKVNEEVSFSFKVNE